jgi:hypothetical protein
VTDQAGNAHVVDEGTPIVVAVEFPASSVAVE